MADMDLEDLDAPSQAPTRAARFAPKNSKFKPKPKVEPPVSSSDSVPITKREELDIKPSLNGSTISTTAKAECEPLPPSSDTNGTVKMDVEEAKPEGEEPETVPMDADGGEDEVVREIDVYFTPSIDANTQLYVLQYPLRPLWRPYELEERCEEVRVKPVNAEVEVDFAVDVDSKNYDPDSKAKMKKQTLSSSWKPPRTTDHAVGILIGNKLYLNPIHAVVQLRPSMEHLKSKRGELMDEKSVGLPKKQNKLPGASNEQNKDIEECWVPLKFHGARSDLSARYFRQMVAEEGYHIQFSMSPYDYMNSLCPGALNDNVRSKGPSRRFLLSLPLEDRYKTWLLKGPPVNRFDAVKHLAPDDSIEDVLGVLQKLAQLVQGLWVPKSSLYGKDDGPEVLARDYTLLLFSKSPVISNTQLPRHPGFLKAMKDILNVLAVERHSFNDWKFKEPPDVAFIKLYPHIVQEQEQAWERLEKTVTDHVFGARNNRNNPSKPNISDRRAISNKGGLKTSDRAPSRMPMSDETREALPKALLKVFQTHKVCSFQQICQRLREMAVSESARPKGVAREAIAAAHGVDSSQEELQAIINQVAINIHGVYVSKSSPDHPQYDGLRKIVIDLLIAEGPNAKLKKASISEAAKLQLSRDVTPNEYQKVLNELCISQGSAWVLKRGDGNPK